MDSILAHMALTPQGQDQYRAMSVAQRLAMLQQPGAPLRPNDQALLGLLRWRREREGGGPMMPQGQPQPMGAMQRIGGAVNAAAQQRQSLLDALLGF